MSDQATQNDSAQHAAAQAQVGFPDASRGGGSRLPFEMPAGQGSIEDVFLTPRVIDQNAFTRYSETLKTLIREASGSGDTLRTSAQSAHVLVEESRAAGKDLRTKIEAGAKLVKIFDDRIERTSAAIEEAATRARRIEELDKNIDTNVAQRLEALESRLASVFDSFESRANQAEQRLVTAEQTALRHAQKLEEVAASLELKMQEFEERSARIVGETEGASERVAERARTLTQGLEERANELTRIGEPAQRLCRRTLAALALDPDNPGENEEHAAAAIIEGVEIARQRADEATQRLGESGRMADESRQKLASSLVEAGEHIESLTRRAGEAREQADQGLEVLRSARPELEGVLSAAREQIQALRAEHASIEEGVRESARLAEEGGQTLTRQRHELEALLDASVQRLGSRVEEAGAWLGGLITRAAQTGQALERVIVRTGVEAPSSEPGSPTPPTNASHAGDRAHAPSNAPSNASQRPVQPSAGQPQVTPSWAPPAPAAAERQTPPQREQSPAAPSPTTPTPTGPSPTGPSQTSAGGYSSWAPTPELPRELRDTPPSGH